MIAVIVVPTHSDTENCSQNHVKIQQLKSAVAFRDENAGCIYIHILAFTQHNK